MTNGYYIYSMVYPDKMPSFHDLPDVNFATPGNVSFEEPVINIIEYVYKLVDQGIISKDFAIRFGKYNSGTEYCFIRDLNNQKDYLALK